MSSTSAAACSTCHKPIVCHECREKTAAQHCDRGGACHKNEEVHSWCQGETAQTLIKILEKVSLVALVVIAFYMEPELCGYFAAGGFALGVAMYWRKPIDWKKEREAVGCSQGLMEQLTGTKLPPPTGLIANVAITYAHLVDHHCSHIFGPIVAFSAGIFAGRVAGHYIPKALDYLRGCVTAHPSVA